MSFEGLVSASSQMLTTAMQHTAPYGARIVGLCQYRAVAVLTLAVSTVATSLFSFYTLRKIFEAVGNREYVSRLAAQVRGNQEQGPSILNSYPIKVVSFIGLVTFIGGANIGLSKLLNLPLHWAVSAYLTCCVMAATLGIKSCM